MLIRITRPVSHILNFSQCLLHILTQKLLTCIITRGLSISIYEKTKVISSYKVLLSVPEVQLENSSLSIYLHLLSSDIPRLNRQNWGV
jgi:hypothetical protein